MDEEALRNIPSLPGVYIMKGRRGEVLYIGKSGSLKKRVSSYFRPDADLSPRISLMVKKVRDVSFVVTGSEAEALITEAAYIKRYRPRYNVALKDDKSYPHLRLTAKDEFPRLEITRRLEEDGSIYYGPYTDVKLLRSALRIMQKIFPLRTCKRMPKKVCLNYRIGQCYAPCIGAIGKRDYNDIVDQVKLFLEGKREKLIGELSKKMNRASLDKEFELAARIRDRIHALSVVPQRLPKSYSKGYVNEKGRRPKKGGAKPYDEITALRYFLNMRRVPRKIEAFDISNISGKEAVGSMIAFVDGLPSKDDYRRFRIKFVKGIDDYKMMQEVITRRYRRVKRERLECPDLIVIDGGKGQLNAARSALERLGFSRIPVIGIAKRHEHIFIAGRREPIIFSEHSPVLHLVQRLRDEAHRFAIGYHRLLKRKKLKKSVLDDIIGIGRKRKKILIREFGSIEGIRSASAEDISAAAGIDRKTAKRIKQAFKNRRT